MSEFEKELDVKIKSGEIMKERYKTGCILSHFVNLKDIESTFKDWQPPKPLVVVPQFVSDWFDITEKDGKQYTNFRVKDLNPFLERNEPVASQPTEKPKEDNPFADDDDDLLF